METAACGPRFSCGLSVGSGFVHRTGTPSSPPRVSQQDGAHTGWTSVSGGRGEWEGGCAREGVSRLVLPALPRSHGWRRSGFSRIPVRLALPLSHFVKDCLCSEEKPALLMLLASF